MIFKNTRVNISDTSGLVLKKIFHVYSKKGFIIGNGFLYGSIRQSFKKQSNSIGKKKRSFLIRSLKTKLQKDSSNILFFKNNVVILKKRMSILGKYIKGPTTYSIKRKKFLTSFNYNI